MPLPDLDLTAVRTLLCDADGTLFASEEPAFEASVGVTNAYLEQIGAPERYTAEQLRLAANGKSFRLTLTELARAHGVATGSTGFARDLEAWVAQENEVVTRHLAAVLAPDEDVSAPLRALDAEFGLALVSSSSLTRIDASLRSAALDGLFPVARRFSAQDSLPVPTSKPDPAVYRLALQQLGLAPGAALAVEDAVPGAQSAVAAGLYTVGMLCFVPPAERAERVVDLQRAGVHALVDTWAELAALLRRSRPTPTPDRKDGALR
ncbi:HAD family hydrolase [Microlunatus capsulatus]|uniref:Beta-phosphoglucomutase-like phosphatase (HAD superfamily) n=1 Tax=Microlunatus capsulatus TaxID=99117 RepID=A0ABS4Z2M7_9ACTN|nr:HAD family phosphatase [Microlunatus capsulatus]MBP2415229.1 beta-phosphoglucomutase-like phosphatase (HAD superfamily) [Microlunatus capsulatus]